MTTDTTTFTKEECAKIKADSDARIADFTEKLGDEIGSFMPYIDIIDDVEFLENLAQKIYHYVELVSGVRSYFPIPRIGAAERISKRIQKVTPDWFKNNPVVMKET